MTYVAARTFAQGRRAGIVSALGTAVGCVDPARGPAGLQTLDLGRFFDAQETIVNVVVACLAASCRSALKPGRPGAWMQRVSGAVLVALNLRLALARSNG
jgi:threonine/homoserine/homoserine lactone efflux protein